MEKDRNKIETLKTVMYSSGQSRLQFCRYPYPNAFSIFFNALFDTIGLVYSNLGDLVVKSNIFCHHFRNHLYPRGFYLLDEQVDIR